MERLLDINAGNKNRNTPLHFAAKSGDTDVVKSLLETKGIDVNAKDSDGNTPLHLAAIKSHIDVVETLLKIEGIDVNSRNEIGWNILFSTVFSSYKKKEDLVKTKTVPVIRALLRSGASPLLECNGNTPISLAEIIKNNDVKHCLEEEAKKVRNIINAVYGGNTSLLDSLLKEGVNVNTTDERGNTILHFAALLGRKETVEFLLKKREINVNAKNKCKLTPLHYAAITFDHSYLDIVKTLLTMQGIDVNAKDNNGSTPLHFFAREGRIDVVKTLLTMQGIDVNAKDNNGNTPLYLAAFKGHIDVVKALLETKGIDVNTKDNNGNTPLHLAAVEGHIDIVKALLKRKGIGINAKNNKGDTPLDSAVFKGYIDVVEALSKKGAKVYIINEREYTSLHVAAYKGHLNIVKALLKRKGIVDVNAKDSRGSTPLHVAAVEGHIDIVNALLETKGIDVNVKDNNGNTPLHLATVEGHIDIVEAMKNKGNSFEQQEYGKDIVAVSAIAILGVTIAACLFTSGVVAAEPTSIMLAVFSIVVVSLELSGITHDIIRKMEDNLLLSKKAESKDPLLSEDIGSDLQLPIVNSCCEVTGTNPNHGLA